MVNEVVVVVSFFFLTKYHLLLSGRPRICIGWGESREGGDRRYLAESAQLHWAGCVRVSHAVRIFLVLLFSFEGASREEITAQLSQLPLLHLISRMTSSCDHLSTCRVRVASLDATG